MKNGYSKIVKGLKDNCNGVYRNKYLPVIVYLTNQGKFNKFKAKEKLSWSQLLILNIGH
jgi:hypothetical protein